MSVDFKTLSIALPAAVDDVFVVKAPDAANGGGLRVLEASVVNHAATSSTVSYTVALHRYSNAGTPAVNGTVAAAMGGTASHWADNVPQDMTIDSAYSFVGAGEYLVASLTAQNGGAPTRAYLMLTYVPGK